MSKPKTMHSQSISRNSAPDIKSESLKNTASGNSPPSLNKRPMFIVTTGGGRTPHKSTSPSERSHGPSIIRGNNQHQERPSQIKTERKSNKNAFSPSQAKPPISKRAFSPSTTIISE